MPTARIAQPARPTPLRLWPGIAAGLLVLVLRFGVPWVAPDAELLGIIAFLGGVLMSVAIVVWWAFFSRAPRIDRWGAVVLIVLSMAATPLILHESIATGMMGMMFYIYAIPALGIGIAAGAAAGHRLAGGPRRALMAAAILIACGMWALLRTDGILGGGGSQFAWRWSPTAEEQLLARAGSEPVAPVVAPPEMESTRVSPSVEEPKPPAAGSAVVPPVPVSAKVPGANPTAVFDDESTAATSQLPPKADWPGFRGPGRDGVVHGARVATDWSASPPAELWRHAVGPGWSSFAAGGGLLYTQEQRGDSEVVACYKLATGEPVWMHRDATRFWESNAGAGPRGTPTLSNGRLYTLGATGILNALDAQTGAVIWSRNAASDTGEKVPMWGFSSSPLLVGDLVVVATAGQLAAYGIADGELGWMGPESGDSYSSPQLLTIGDTAQILLLDKHGVTSVAPADGSRLWQHTWEGFTSLQPTLTTDGDVLITTSTGTGGLGVRRLAVQHGPNGWSAEERWTSKGLKPYFNDLVVHKGHAYGFDGRILSCISLDGGERRWKGGRYGNGQLILLAEQDLLLVLSEYGELALVGATPGVFKEIAKFPAIEGKTWNHPALVGDVVLVRNDREMAAFRLARAGD